jgi:hypothetical protein
MPSSDPELEGDVLKKGRRDVQTHTQFEDLGVLEKKAAWHDDHCVVYQ